MWFFMQTSFVTRVSYTSRNFSFTALFSRSQLLLVIIPNMTASQIPLTSSTYLEAVKHRRTVYGVTDTISVSDDRIIEIVNQVIQSLPSSWNMQSTRILVTLGKEHKRFWDVVINVAKPFILGQKGEEDWQRNEERFRSFQNAYGTVCIFSTSS